jgi:hypothetical protein
VRLEAEKRRYQELTEAGPILISAEDAPKNHLKARSARNEAVAKQNQTKSKTAAKQKNKRIEVYLPNDPEFLSLAKRILKVISEADSQVSKDKICETCKLDKPAVSRVMTRLRHLKLINRVGGKAEDRFVAKKYAVANLSRALPNNN